MTRTQLISLNTISQSALIRRIRRALHHWNRRLVIARGDDAKVERGLGRYYLVDGNGNVKEHHCNLPNLARDLMVLRAGEALNYSDLDGMSRTTGDPAMAAHSVQYRRRVRVILIHYHAGQFFGTWPHRLTTYRGLRMLIAQCSRGTHHVVPSFRSVGEAMSLGLHQDVTGQWAGPDGVSIEVEIEDDPGR